MADNSFAGLDFGAPDAGSGAAPAGNSFSGLDWGPPGEEGAGGNQTGVLGSLLTHAGVSAAPAAAGLAGAGAGAEIGLAAGPIGALAGGLIGGIGASYAAGKAQDYAINKLPGSWKDPLEQALATEEKEHPVASFLGGLAPFAVTMSPFSAGARGETALQRIMSTPVTARLFGGGLQGGIELGQEELQGESPDWTKIGVSTGFGIMFAHPNRLGERVTEVGARPVRTILGRPQPAAPAASPTGGVATPANVAPTVAEAKDAKVMGAGVDEAVATGEAVQNPAVAQQAQQEARDEAAIIKPAGPPEPLPLHDVVRNLHEDLFARYDALTAMRRDLEDAGADAHLPAIDAAIDELVPEVRSAINHEAERAGTPTAPPLGQIVSVGGPPQADGTFRLYHSTGENPAGREAAPFRASTSPTAYAAYGPTYFVDVPARDLAPYLDENGHLNTQVVNLGPEWYSRLRPVKEAKAVPPIEEQKARIAADVARQLIAARRPEDEAHAAGQVYASEIASLAEQFGGKIGTAEELYAREGARIVGEGTKVSILPPTAPVAEPTPSARDLAAAADEKARELAGKEPPAPVEREGDELHNEGVALWNQIKELDKGFASGVAGHLSSGKIPLDQATVDFWRDRLEMLKAQHGEGEKPVETIGLRDYLERDDATAFDSLKGESKPLMDEAAKFFASQVSLINAAGFNVRDVNALSPRLVQDAKKQLSQIAGTASRLLKGERALVRGEPSAKKDNRVEDDRQTLRDLLEKAGAIPPTSVERFPEIRPADETEILHAKEERKEREAHAKATSPEAIQKDRSYADEAGATDRIEEDFGKGFTVEEIGYDIRNLLDLSPGQNEEENFIENVARSLGIPVDYPERMEGWRASWEARGQPQLKFEQTPKEPRRAFIDAVKEQFAAGSRPFTTIVEARNLAKSLGLEIKEGESANKTVDELVERAVVESARETVNADKAAGVSPEDTFAKIVKLYDNQPNLSSRTSTSVAEQAYSTPAPLAYIASRLAGIDRDTKVLEPTAGNGMLLIEADPRKAVVNELNGARAKSLHEQGFRPTGADASDNDAFEGENGSMDVVIANPPFGTVREGGEAKQFIVKGPGGDFVTTQIDHAIALNALKTMKEDGKAVLILGGVLGDTQKARAESYTAAAKRRFYYRLLKEYKVKDIFTVSGDLYTKQGASFPVDVIVIDGKGESTRDPLTKTPPPLLKTWEEVAGKLHEAEQAAKPATEARPNRPEGGKPVEGPPRPGQANGVGGAPPVGSGLVGGGPGGPQPVPMDGTRNSSEPGPDGAKPTIRGGKGAPPRESPDVREPRPPANPQGGGTVERPSGYGANNTLVTKERADALRERLRQKLREASSTTSSGIDPEMLQIGAELTAFHIEAGVRSFADFVAAITQDLGARIEELRPYLRSWYNGARDMMEDHGHDVTGLDPPDKVRSELDRLVAESSAPPPPRPPRPEEPPSEGQSPYEPASQRGESLNTLLPSNLKAATTESLKRLEAEHGPVDDYVAKSLGLPVDQLASKEDGTPRFSAEQIDAIGLGISNIEKGAGFIIGDQTGIGKGRVVAAMISYAKRVGLLPIFVTEKPDLYGDMWRDLHDIGWHEQLGRPINMVMTNAGTRIPLDDEALEWQAERDEAKAEDRPVPPLRGAWSRSQTAEAARGKMQGIASALVEHVIGTETPPPLPDVVFTTYDQMNSVRGGETDRRQFLRAVAPNAFLIMDEAHNAGGSGVEEEEGGRKAAIPQAPPRSKVFREAIQAARSVMYSSATYAKSPQVMTLYSKTDMAKAVDNIALLPELIKKGGVPLQQVVAAMLAKAGQYMRRERSFDGVSYDHEEIPVDEHSYGEFTDGLRGTYTFDRSFAKERKEIAKAIAAEMGAGSQNDTAVGDTGASTTAFSSIMHNVIGQMIVALKAEKAADHAIAAIRRGEKPVITLSKTNASFINDFSDAAGLKVGDIANITFNDILKRYLERTRRVTIKLGNDEKIHVMIPLERMSVEAQENYHKAEQILEQVRLENLPVSPIDAMRHRIQQAGYSVREITGRDQMLDYSGGEPVIVKRPSSEMGSAGKKMTVKQFNDGRVDALILNRSGSTGISLHASRGFRDQRRRRMIIAEPDSNIDTHMQTLGRVHRTGQVIAPAYTHLSADIPAEVRPTAVLMGKMASLNANTTGATKSKFTSEAVDFLNKYGDQVVANILLHDPETYIKLGRPNILTDADKPIPDAAQKATGRLTLLKPDEQETFLNEVMRQYKQMIAELDATGTNDLEAKSLDLQARTQSSSQLRPAKGPSPFEGGANLDKMSIKSQGRAMKPEDVVQAAGDALGIVGRGEFPQALETISEAGRKAHEALIEKTVAAARERLGVMVAILKDEEAKTHAREEMNKAIDHWKSIAEFAHPGAVVNLSLNGEPTPAVVIGFKPHGEAKSPVAASSWEVTMALPSGIRSIGIPLSRIDVGTIAEEGHFALSPEYYPEHEELARNFEAANKSGREDRYLVTGNLLAGYDATEGRGQIINYTTDTGEIRPGILMSRAFNATNFLNNRAIRFQNGEHVIKYIDALANVSTKRQVVQSTDGNIKIQKARWGDTYDFAVPSSKAQGGKYYADRTVRDVYDNWERRGALMMAKGLDRDLAVRLIDALRGVDAVFETKENQQLATDIGEEGRTLAQSAYGKFFSKPSNPRATITIMKEAKASTAIHEFGHDFLERMARYAVHPEAPDQLKADWQTVKSWAGIKDDAARIPTKAHEKFARGFEQYMREGVAPTASLSRVFQQFKNWLTSLYQTIRGLGEPINDDIRRVFDRMLTTPERPTIITPERPAGPTLADIHEADATEAPKSPEAEAVADRIIAEQERREAETPPEIGQAHETAIAKIEAAEAAAKPAAEGATGAEQAKPVEAGGEGSGPNAGERGVGGAEQPVVGGGGEGGAKGVELPPGSEFGRPLPGQDARHGPIPSQPTVLGPDARYVDKAGNIRLDNLNAPEDVKEVIREVAEANKDFVGDRRGVITDGQVMELADALGMQPGELSRRKLGQAFNAEQIWAARKLLISSATDLHGKAQIAARDTASDEELMAYAMARDRHQMIQGQVAGITAEAGRALRAFRAMPGSEGAKAIGDIIKKATGRTLFQMAEEARLVAGLETPEEVSGHMARARVRSYGAMILEYWINNLISGISTHITYTLANKLRAYVSATLETPTAAMIGAMRERAGRTGERVFAGEAGAQLQADWRAQATAMKYASESFRTGVTTRLPGERRGQATPFEPAAARTLAPQYQGEIATARDAAASVGALFNSVTDGIRAGGALLRAGGVQGEPTWGVRHSPLGAIPDITFKGVAIAPVGQIARGPSRMVAALHTYTRVNNYIMSIAAQAYRQASAEGLADHAFAARVQELQSNPTQDMMKRAVAESTQSALMEQNGAIAKKLASFINVRTKLPLLGETQPLKFIDPFVHISSNILRQSLRDRTALGILSPEIRAQLRGDYGNVVADTAAAKIVVGSLIALGFGALAANGYARGSGSPDPRMRAVEWAAGYQPHSVRIGDMWYQVNRLGVMGMLLSVSADLWDVAQHAEKGEMTAAGWSLVQALHNNIMDESWMRGPADLINALQHPGQYGERYIREQLASFLPYSVGLQQMDRATDPYLRQVRSIADAIKSKVPGYSETLLPKRDIWGQPIPNREALIKAGVTSLWEQKMSRDPVNIAMINLGVAPSFLSRSIRGVALDDVQYDDYMRVAGAMAHDRLTKIVLSPQFQAWPGHVKHDVIKETINQSREAARGWLMMKYPSIISQSYRQKKDRMAQEDEE